MAASQLPAHRHIALLECEDAEKWQGYTELLWKRALKEPCDSWTVYRACKGELPTPEQAANFDAMIIGGSHYSAYEEHDWIQKLLDLLPKYAKQGTRMYGCCFGCQIIAKALGGSVGPNPDGNFVLTIEKVQPTQQLQQHPALQACVQQALQFIVAGDSISNGASTDDSTETVAADAHSQANSSNTGSTRQAKPAHMLPDAPDPAAAAAAAAVDSVTLSALKQQSAPASDRSAALAQHGCFRLIESHGDQVLQLPPGAVCLATSPTAKCELWCWGSNVFASQFHVEFDEPLVIEKIWGRLKDIGRLSEQQAERSKTVIEAGGQNNDAMLQVIKHFLKHGVDDAAPAARSGPPDAADPDANNGGSGAATGGSASSGSAGGGADASAAAGSSGNADSTGATVVQAGSAPCAVTSQAASVAAAAGSHGNGAWTTDQQTAPSEQKQQKQQQQQKGHAVHEGCVAQPQAGPSTLRIDQKDDHVNQAAVGSRYVSEPQGTNAVSSSSNSPNKANEAPTSSISGSSGLNYLLPKFGLQLAASGPDPSSPTAASERSMASFSTSSAVPFSHIAQQRVQEKREADLYESGQRMVDDAVGAFDLRMESYSLDLVALQLLNNAAAEQHSITAEIGIALGQFVVDLGNRQAAVRDALAALPQLDRQLKMLEEAVNSLDKHSKDLEAKLGLTAYSSNSSTYEYLASSFSRASSSMGLTASAGAGNCLRGGPQPKQ